MAATATLCCLALCVIQPSHAATGSTRSIELRTLITKRRRLGVAASIGDLQSPNHTGDWKAPASAPPPSAARVMLSGTVAIGGSWGSPEGEAFPAPSLSCYPGKHE